MWTQGETINKNEPVSRKRKKAGVGFDSHCTKTENRTRDLLNCSYFALFEIKFLNLFIYLLVSLRAKIVLDVNYYL